MPTVSIIIRQNDNNTNSGSREDLVLNSTITLLNQNDTGVVAWLWQMIDKPENSGAAINNPTQAIATFTPDIEGTYLIRLTINNGQLSAQVGAAVKTINLHYRIPAATESQEFDLLKGWATDISRALVAIDDGYGNLSSGAGVKNFLNIGTISSPGELRGSTGAAHNQTVSISGFYEAGDGGGGRFYWDANNSSNDDGGIVINPTGNVGNGRWVRIIGKEAYNVKWWGAKGKADLIADDYPAFQAALDYITATAIVTGPLERPGATIIIPPGYYRISQTLNLTRSITLQGNGNDTTLLFFNDHANGTTGTIIDGIVVQGDNNDIKGRYSVIKDLGIYGNGLSYNQFQTNQYLPIVNEWDTLTASTSHQVHDYTPGSGIVMRVRGAVENCTINSFRYDGIHVEGADDVTANVGSCYFNYCKINGNGRHGIYIQGESSNVITISACDINANNGWNVYDRSFLGNTYIGLQSAEGGYFITNIGALLIDDFDTDAESSLVLSGVYCGANDGGVYHSLDTGVNWSSRNIGISNPSDADPHKAVLTQPITSLASDHSANLYAASSAIYNGLTPGGVYKLNQPKYNRQWLQVNNGLTDTDVRALATDNTTVYAGTHTGGVFITTDHADNWTQANTGLTTLDIRALINDPANVGTVYAGTYGGGVFKSTDHGTSWSQVNTGLTSLNILSFGIVSGLLYAGCSDGKIFKTVDGASNWSQVFVQGSGYQINAIVIDPSNSTIAYAATGGAGVYKTTNTGGSWSQVNTGLADPSFLTPLLNVRSLAIYVGVLYCGVTPVAGYHPFSNAGGVFVTIDGAANWIEKGDTLRYGGGYFALGGIAENVFLGCYAESDQNNEIGYPSVVLGGILGGAVGPTSTGLILNQNGINNIPVHSPVYDKVRVFTAIPSNYLTTLGISGETVLLVDASAVGFAEVGVPSPSDSIKGIRYLIKKIDNSTNYVYMPTLTGTIEGQPYIILFEPGGWIEIEATSGDWKVVGRSAVKLPSFTTGTIPSTSFVDTGFTILNTTTGLVNVNHGTQFVPLANDGYVVHNERRVDTGVGLTGGGDLSQDRTLDLSSSGISPSTYQSTSFDAYGRAIAANKLFFDVVLDGGAVADRGDNNSGNGTGTDIAPAIQLAFDQVLASGHAPGIDIFIPAGRYRWTTAVNFFFADAQNYPFIRIRGIPGQTEIFIDGGIPDDRILLYIGGNISGVEMEHLIFRNNAAPFSNTSNGQQLLFIQGQAQTYGIIKDCHFYGLAHTKNLAEIVAGFITVSRSGFWGAGGYGLPNTDLRAGVINCSGWAEAIIEDCTFWDYGNFDESHTGITTLGNGPYGIVFQRPNVRGFGAPSQGSVIIRRCSHDERLGPLILVGDSGQPRIAAVSIEDVHGLLPGANNAAMVIATNVNRLELKRCAVQTRNIGLTLKQLLVDTYDVDSVVVSNCSFGKDAGDGTPDAGIRTDSLTKYLRIEESDAFQLFNNAATVLDIRDGAPDKTKGYCVQFRGPNGTIKTQINHGFFWPPPPSENGPDDLGMFWWEFICSPNDAGSTYMLSDGSGGAHAALLGFGQSGAGTVNSPAGNFTGNPGTNFTGSSYGLMNNEWGVVAYGYDPVTQKIYLYVNGILYDQFSYSGTRTSTTEVSGGGRRLYIGGSDHSNFSGKIQMYRGAEGGNFPLISPLLGYRPERVFRNQFYDSSNLRIRDMNLLCDLTVPAKIVADLSSGAPAGYQGIIHPGSIHSVSPTVGLDDGIPHAGGSSAYPLPKFIIDPTAPLYSPDNGPTKQNFYPALTPPSGVVAYDSFGGPESSYFYDDSPSLGQTEVGGFTWQTFSSLSSNSTIWGRRAYQAVYLDDGTATAAYISDSSLPTDFDVRIEFSDPLNGVLTGPVVSGLAFRVSAYNSFLFVVVCPNGELFCSGAGSLTTWYGLQASPNYPTPYTKVRVTGVGNLLTLYVDDGANGWLQVFQATEPFNSGVKGYGIANWVNPVIGTPPNGTARWMNFSVRSA